MIQTKLSERDVQKHLLHLPNWAMIDRKMSRSYKFYNFIESIQFVNRVAQAAVAINRHPDIYIRGNVVSLTLTPPDSDGVLLSDFQLAASLDDAADQINR